MIESTFSTHYFTSVIPICSASVFSRRKGVMGHSGSTPQETSANVKAEPRPCSDPDAEFSPPKLPE